MFERQKFDEIAAERAVHDGECVAVEQRLQRHRASEVVARLESVRLGKQALGDVVATRERRARDVVCDQRDGAIHGRVAQCVGRRYRRHSRRVVGHLEHTLSGPVSKHSAQHVAKHVGIIEGDSRADYT